MLTAAQGKGSRQAVRIKKQSIGKFTAFCVLELKPPVLPSYSSTLLERFQAVCYQPSSQQQAQHETWSHPFPSPADLFHSRNFNLFAGSHISNSLHYSIKNNPSCLKGELSLQKKPSSSVLLHPSPNQVVLDMELLTLIWRSPHQNYILSF